MNTTLLSLSLLNGQLKAVAFHRGTVAGQWECPEPVSDFTDFAATLRRIVEETHFTGNQVSLVVAHPRLTQQLVETPPVKGWKLRAFLERRVRQFKAIASEAAWSHQQTLPTRNTNAVLLHLTSKTFLDQLDRACQQAGLRLVQVFPATVVLSRELSQVPGGREDVALLAAESGSGTTVVVGRRDGQIYLGRSLSSSWNSHPDRVSTDLNRTILYVKQQFGATVTSVWLSGQGAEAQAAALQAAVGVPVRVSPAPAAPFRWNHEAARLSANTSGNLITTEQQKAPERRVLARATAVMIGLLAMAALVVTASVQLLARDREAQLKKLDAKLQELETRKGKLEQREAELNRQKDFIRIVSDEQVPAVGGWFLGHLGYIMPPDLLLTSLDLKREEDLWRVQLGGTLQPTPQSDSASVAALAEQLAGGPFHLEVSRGAADQLSGASPPGSNPGAPDHPQFFLEGVMR